MLRRIRAWLGICNHVYVVIEKRDVVVKHDGSFLSIDRAFRGEISHRLFVRSCSNCGKLSTLKVDIHTGGITCQ